MSEAPPNFTQQWIDSPDPAMILLNQQFGTLTPRQLQVAAMLALGRTNASIARELGISVKTVDTHRQDIMLKLELANNVELARAALRVGLVTL